MKNIYILILFLCSLQVMGQEMDTSTPDEKRWNMFTYDMGNIFKSMGYSYSRPLHWQGKQWLNFGEVVAGTGVLYLIDDDTSRFIRKQQTSVPKFLREYGSLYGNPENNYIATAGVYLTGLALKNEKLRRTGVLLIASASSSGLLQQVLKSVVGRARPVADLGKDTFDPFNPSRNFHSFPSGHTILAFTNAYAIAKQFKSPWIKSAIYLGGLIPGMSRIWDGQHWLSDVAISVAISIFTVESIDRYLDSKYDEKYNDQSKDMSWDLNFGPGTLGVTLRF